VLLSHQAVKRRLPLSVETCNCLLALLNLMPASLLLLLLLSHQAVKRRLPLSVETCPHYLLFSAEQIAGGDTKFKCAPPLRDEQNRWAQACCCYLCCYVQVSE
jgi:dihydroorotase-like cyclic amidohydrolase